MRNRGGFKFAKEHDYVKYAKIDVDCGGSRGSVRRKRMRPCGCGTYAGGDLEQFEHHQIREHLRQVLANRHFVRAEQQQHGVEQPLAFNLIERDRQHGFQQPTEQPFSEQPVDGHHHGKQGARHVEHGRHRA